MKKFLCYLLASMTLLASVSTAACGGGSDDSFDSGSGQVSVSDSEDTGETSIAPEDVTLSFKKKSYSIEGGQTVALQVEFSYNGEALDMALLQFSSSDNSVATVDANGVVTGVATGKATITVAYGKRATKATINVATRAYRLEASKERVMLLKGEEEQVTAKAYFALDELTDAVIAWESSNPSVATVENGLIKGVGAGEAKITLSFEDAEEVVAVTIVEEISKENVNTFSEDYINIYGRSYISANSLALDHVASTVDVGICGASFKTVIDASAESYMRIYVDGVDAGKIRISPGTNEYTLASGLEEGCHTVRIVKCTEENNAVWKVKSFEADKFFVMTKKPDLKIEFIGDSHTVGYGILGSSGQEHSVQNSDVTQTYAYLTAYELGANYSFIASSGICTKLYFWAPDINMDTLYDCFSKTNQNKYDVKFDADVVVLNLGTNESTYLSYAENGVAYGPQFPIDYQAFLQKIRKKNPNAHIICLYGMSNRSGVITNGIRTAIENLGDEKIVYNPFTVTMNNEAVGNHSSPQTHREHADLLKAYIQTIL